MVDMDDQVARRQPLEDVARDHSSERLRAPDPDCPEQLAVGDEGKPVRAADKAAVEAPLDERDGAGWRRFDDPVDHGHRVPGLAEQVGQPRCLVRGEHDPGAVGSPGLDGGIESPGTTRRQDRLAPAERVTRRQPAAGHRDVFGWDRFPGQLKGPGRDQAALPVARGQIGRRPVLGQVVGFDQLGPPLVGLSPQEPGRLGDVARLVQHEECPGFDVVQTRRRGEVGGPHLGRIADGHRPAGSVRVRRAGRVEGRRIEPLEVRRQPLREPGGGATQALPDGRGAPGREQELGRGQEDGRLERADRALVGRVERPE